ncbi:diversity-generating retroelement protein Avd [Gracilinema caldarium]|uniref:diversity-generating retroelement protein Avd n=1 Tax=Gracilinema caldarium TaxID=215591 RepID=UPI0026EBD1FF|nr:diversity-generating retroelement protein Avd [Gracilinema caldarium]
MSEARGFVLWQKAEDFVEYLFPIVDRFPKYEKFALCSQIKNTCYVILKLIIKTNKSKQKTPGLYEIDVQLEMLRWLIRHSYRRKYLSHQCYETAARMVDELGRIVGGLLKGV